MARSEDFVLGADRVRDPVNDPYQTDALRPRAAIQPRRTGLDDLKEVFSQKYPAQRKFQVSSVLDRPGDSGMGLSAEDRTRLLVNGDRLPSPNGMSAKTYERRQAIGLETPFRALRKAE